ncbi:hypothetical protein BC940DRAFT_235338 [Gongronella butleri]|nr:hypothetical protein BC940DRAFT_235338 [Gongronella butleri]
MTAKYNGGFLKDDNATLVSLGIRPYATIQLLGDAVNNQQVQQTASGNPEEVGCLLRIDAINTRIAALGKKAVELEHQVKAPPKDTHALTQSLNYLCEMLMKELMALDAVECPAAFATARQNRRNAVSKCQAMLDNIEQWKAQLQQAS